MEDKNNQYPNAPQPLVNPQPAQQSNAPTPLGQYQQPVAPVSYDNGMFGRRMGRLAYVIGGLYIVIPFFIIVFGTIALSFSVDTASTGPGGSGESIYKLLVPVLTILFVLVLLPVSISMSVRRLHDLNQPGIFVLLSFVPFVSMLLGIYLLFFPGTNGVNKYGPPVSSLHPWVVLGFKKP